MNTSEKKKKIKEIVKYLQRQGLPIELGIQHGIGGKIFIFEDGREGRDISPRLGVNDLYNYMIGFKDGMDIYIYAVRKYIKEKDNKDEK